MAEPKETPPTVSNITPIKKKNPGNPNLKNLHKATGPRKNEPAKAEFKKNNYYLPGDVELGFPTVFITRDEIKELGMKGCTWETIENLFQVSQTNIKEYYEGIYNQGRAILEVKVMEALTDKATRADGTADRKWLTQNKMGMSEKSADVTEKPKMDETELMSKIDSLLRKVGPK